MERQRRDRRPREELVHTIARRLEQGESRSDIVTELTLLGWTREEAEAILHEASPPRHRVRGVALGLLAGLAVEIVFLLTELVGGGNGGSEPSSRPGVATAPSPTPFPSDTASTAPQAAAPEERAAQATPTPNPFDTTVPIPTPLSMAIPLLSFFVTDAEYSKQLDRIIMVSSGPNRLHIYDPVTEEDTAVDLPLPPSAVSVSPDGQHAAVGHDAWISYVNLASASLEKTMPVSMDVLDIVLAGNGYVYASPRAGRSDISSVNIATEVETRSNGRAPDSLFKLHPGGEAVYGVNTNFSPSDIQKYSIESGTAELLYDSPYHGDYPTCGDIWMSRDGLRIFTKCGNVFRSSDDRDQDMLYNGALREVGGRFIRHLTHADAIDRVIVIPQGQRGEDQMLDTQIQVYDYQFLTFEIAIGLPQFVVKDRSYPGHGRFVFVSADGGENLRDHAGGRKLRDTL